MRMGEALSRLGRDAEASRSPGAGERAGADRSAIARCSRRRRGCCAEVYVQLGDLARRAHRGAARARAGREGRLAHRTPAWPIACSARSSPRAASPTRTSSRPTSTCRSRSRSSARSAHELELGRTYQSYADVLHARGDADGAATFNERATEITERLGPQGAARLLARKTCYARRVPPRTSSSFAGSCATPASRPGWSAARCAICCAARRPRTSTSPPRRSRPR